MVVRSEASWSVAVTARDEDSAATLLFFSGSSGEKVIRLEAWRVRILKAAGGYELRQHLELLKQSVVEFASALVSRKFLMPIGGGFQRVPGDEHGAWLLIPIKSQQQIRKAENSAGRLAATPQDRFRKGVIGERWANESPSMTSSGWRVTGAVFRPPRRLADLDGFSE